MEQGHNREAAPVSMEMQQAQGQEVEEEKHVIIRNLPTVSCWRFLQQRRGPSKLCFLLLLLLLSFSTDCEATAVVKTTHSFPKASKLFTTTHHHQLEFAEEGLQDTHVFFEVTKPIDVLPGTTESCSSVLLHQHLFANTINDPPTITQYQPPSNCGGGQEWSKVILKWHATCKGRQFDRISAVWLSGVEIFRTCTAEPSPQGIVWDVEKDITRYSSLLKQPQTVVVELANVVDKTYTGIYNVTISVHFYTGDQQPESSTTPQEESSSNYGGVADLIIPFTLPSPLQGGYWFQLQNESDIRSEAIQTPTNAYKAVLEICVSFHGDDEFWYTNPPNVWLEANNLTGIPGNGSFREVVVFIDGALAAAVFPFPVIYTGGVDPYFWRPVSAIGSFNLPSYDADITPFLGTLLDGKKHIFSITVTNALQTWLLGANLHLWLDKSLERTEGALVEYFAPALTSTLKSDFKGLDGSFLTKASRTISYKGYVESSLGNLTSSATYSFRFSNLLVFTEDSNFSVIHQHTHTDSKVVVNSPVKDVAYDHSSYHFPLTLVYYQVSEPDGSVFINASIDHSFEQDQQSQSTLAGLLVPGRRSTSSFNSLKNKQHSQGELIISPKGVISGLASTKQEYAYESTEGCYFRTLGVQNYTFLYDEAESRCSISA